MMTPSAPSAPMGAQTFSSDTDGFFGDSMGTDTGTSSWNSNVMNGPTPSAPVLNDHSSSSMMQSPPPLSNNNINMAMGTGMNQTMGMNNMAYQPQHQHQQQQQSFAGTSALPVPSAPPRDDMNDNDISTTGNEEEDKVFLQAQEAALEAKAMMERQEEEAKKKQEGGLWGLGLNLKAPNMNFQAPQLFGNNNTANTNTNATNTTEDGAAATTTTSPAKAKSSWFQTKQDDNAERQPTASDFGTMPAAISDSGAPTNPAGAPRKGAAVMGASVVGGVAGFMLMGPIVGVAAAGGVAYAATTKEGAVGNILRGTGSLAASAGGSAKRFDDKHHVVAKTAKGVATGVGWMVKTVNNVTRKDGK